MFVDVVVEKLRAASLRNKAEDTAMLSQLPNHSAAVGRGSAATRSSSRTKGRVRYDRLPTGEVVASIIQEAAKNVASSSMESMGRRGRVLEVDSSPVLPEGYPINRSNVVSVVEEAHRATQSMRILLTSMREELRRAGGLSADGNATSWTDSQRNQRCNVAHRLSVAYQSYRNSIHDIENLRFRSRGSGDAGSRSSRPSSSEVIVLSSDSAGDSASLQARDFAAQQQQRVVRRDSHQVIDLTD